MNILETLQVLNACHGPSGDEREVAVQLKALAAPYVDECSIDTMGNLICHKRGSGPRVLLAAHMDSIGFVVTHIGEKGFLHFGKLGPLQPASCLHTPVRFKNGVKGVVALDSQVEPSKMTLNDLYIDIGAASREEAEAMVQLGDTAVYDLPAVALGKERLSAPHMDNRISCVALLLAMEQIKETSNDLYFVFTVQEALGLRGARTAAYGIEPAYAVVLDVTYSDDEWNPKHIGSSVLGGGAAIKVMDSSAVCHPGVVVQLERLASEHGIPFQRDVLRSGSTDAGAILPSRAGVCTGGISIPCRYLLSPVGIVDRRDVEACAALAAAFAQTELL